MTFKSRLSIFVFDYFFLILQVLEEVTIGVSVFKFFKSLSTYLVDVVYSVIFLLLYVLQEDLALLPEDQRGQDMDDIPSDGRVLLTYSVGVGSVQSLSLIHI